jgi:hypothetical protein
VQAVEQHAGELLQSAVDITSTAMLLLLPEGFINFFSPFFQNASQVF